MSSLDATLALTVDPSGAESRTGPLPLARQRQFRPKVVANLYQGAFFRTPRFADSAGEHGWLTDVQWR
jgi:hypothetical protein